VPLPCSISLRFAIEGVQPCEHPYRRGGVLGGWPSLRSGVDENEPVRDSYDISEPESDLNVIDLALNEMDFAHEKQGPGIVGH
jgi:hypothetical protein